MLYKQEMTIFWSGHVGQLCQKCIARPTLFKVSKCRCIGSQSELLKNCPKSRQETRGGGQKPSLKKVVKHLSFVTVIACPLPVYSSFDQEPVWEFDWFAQDAQ